MKYKKVKERILLKSFDTTETEETVIYKPPFNGSLNVIYKNGDKLFLDLTKLSYLTLSYDGLLYKFINNDELLNIELKDVKNLEFIK